MLTWLREQTINRYRFSISISLTFLFYNVCLCLQLRLQVFRDLYASKTGSEMRSILARAEPTKSNVIN
jgi:hypothetical protein